MERIRSKNIDKGAGLMSREEELQKITKKFNENVLLLLDPLIKQVIFLEEKLEYLKTLPFISVNPANDKQQKVTPAYKQYKDLSQTYINAIKVLQGALGVDKSSLDGLAIEWLKNRAKNKEQNVKNE